MDVLKRDGGIVPYEGDKIIFAVMKAMMECGIVEELALEVGIMIEEEIADMFEEDEALDIEVIQDEIEVQLMKAGFFKVAKAYIKYREEQAKERENDKDKVYGLLSKKFLSKYKHINPPMTELGEFVYYRTYSRFLEDKGRREYWFETVQRAVEYNCSLIPTSVKEAEELFDNIFNLRQFLSGRTFWVGGSEVSTKFPMANYNCSFQVIDNFEAFSDVFYVLMIGSGAGVRVLKDDVKNLPKIRTNINVINKSFSPVNPAQRIQSTSLIFERNMVEIVVGDSKESWIQSLTYFFKLLSSNEYNYIDTIIMNYDNVRPKGERLKTFGGTASGHTALCDMYTKIDKVVKKYKDELKHKLKPIDCLDICNMIGEGVVVGGVRRTSEVVLIDSDDEDCINAKSNLYKQVNGKWEINQDLIHRQMSNNSIYYKSKPTRERLHWQIDKMRYSGEPAWINAESASKRRPDFMGGNPCMEILLNDKGLCNLTTLNVYAFVMDGILDRESLLYAQRLSAKSSYRMTNVELELPKWDKVQAEERLAGCSLTGWQDMANATNMSKEEQAELLRELREVAREEVDKLAKEIGANTSLLVTTVKPEGTLSQLPTVSSGVHYSHSPYYIRRVRINAQDPLLKVCEELNYPIFPEVGQDWATCSTKIVEFPVKAPEGITKYDVSAIEQLENYKMFMENYVDHNCSITVHVRNDEWELVEEWVWENWDEVVAVSFLSLDDNFYEMLPYEAITKEEYERRELECGGKRITPEKISKYEKREVELDMGSDGCDAGVCPIR